MRHFLPKYSDVRAENAKRLAAEPETVEDASYFLSQKVVPKFLQIIVTLSIDKDLKENAFYYNEKIIQKFPNDSKGYVNKAVMLLGEKQPSEAIQNLIDISNKFLDNFMVQYLLGTAYYQVKDYINSEKFLYNALTIYPESRNTKHSLALIHQFSHCSNHIL